MLTLQVHKSCVILIWLFCFLEKKKKERSEVQLYSHWFYGIEDISQLFTVSVVKKYFIISPIAHFGWYWDQNTYLKVNLQDMRNQEDITMRCMKSVCSGQEETVLHNIYIICEKHKFFWYFDISHLFYSINTKNWQKSVRPVKKFLVRDGRNCFSSASVLMKWIKNDYLFW